MPMSFDGVAANTSGWSIGPRARGIGSIGCAARIQYSLPIGHYATATAEHREPCDSRGSCTVLGAPGGESPPGDSTRAEISCAISTCPLFPSLPKELLPLRKLVVRANKVRPWKTRTVGNCPPEVAEFSVSIVAPFL